MRKKPFPAAVPIPPSKRKRAERHPCHNWVTRDLLVHLLIQVESALRGIEALKHGQEQIMATLAEYQSALSRIDAATTKIGAGITALLARLNNPGLTEAEEAQILADIGTRAALLEGIANSVENPVPTPVPNP